MHSAQPYAPLSLSRTGHKPGPAPNRPPSKWFWARSLLLAALLGSPSLILEAQNATASFATATDQHWIFETGDGHIWQIVYTYSDGSFGYMDLTRAANPPSPVPTSELGSLAAADANLYLTRAGNAPPAAPGSGLSSFATDTEQHWVFETAEGHIGQIVYTYASGSFGYGDLTQAANCPPAAIGSGLSSFATATDQHWIFETDDSHIWQIVYTYSNGLFGSMDLTNAATAPPAAVAAGLSSFATDKDQHWVFQTNDGHIWQIVYTTGSHSFGSGDLTQGTGAPLAAIGTGLSSFATDKDQHWVFQDDNGHIWQIVYTYGTCNPFSGLCGSFGYSDLTVAAWALPATVGTGLSSFATDKDQHWVYKTSDGHILQIVYTYSNRSIGYNDLTQMATAPAATFAGTLPTWRYAWNAAKDGKAYTGSLVGTDFFTSSSRTIVPAVIIPVELTVYQNGNLYTFDPTAPDPDCLGAGNTALPLIAESPLFRGADFKINGADVGVTQYGDAQLRAEAWNYVQANGGGYHVLLSPIIGPKLKVLVGDSSGWVGSATGGCGTNTGLVNPPGYFGQMAVSAFDSQAQSFIRQQKFTPGELPIFILYNSDFSPILGYHSTSGSQSYVVAGFIGNQYGPVGAPDISILSHEIGEWLNDPSGINPTPAWLNTGSSPPACQNNMEVGDPLEKSDHLMPSVTMPNGFTYHLQELAFFSWFYGGSSFGAGGSYSTNGTLTTPAAACN